MEINKNIKRIFLALFVFIFVFSFFSQITSAQSTEIKTCPTGMHPDAFSGNCECNVNLVPKANPADGCESPNNGNGNNTGNGNGTENGNNGNGIVNTVKDEVTGTVLDKMFTPVWIILALIQALIAIALAISGAIFSLVIYVNFNLLNSTSPSYNFISVGWTIMRDIANLGFVLFIIIIALATIVRFRDYEAKKLLPRLIGAAILVNFSLAIPTIFINFTHILGNYFLDKTIITEGISGKAISALPLEMRGASSIALQLSGLVKPEILQSLQKDEEKPWLMKIASNVLGTKSVMEFTMKLMTEMTMVTLGLVGIFVIGALSFLFLARFITLHFLLVLAPVTWLFWIIPGLEGQFKTWWRKLLQNVFIFPISIFFLYLTLASANGLFTFMKLASTENLNIFMSPGKGMLYLIQTWVSSMVLVGFLIGSILAGQKLSIAGSGAVMKAGKDLTGKAKSWAKQGAKAGKDKVIRSTGTQGLATKWQGSNNKLKNIAGNWLQRKNVKAQDEYTKKQSAEADLTTRHGDVRLAGDAMKGKLSDEGQRPYYEMVTKEGKKLMDDKEDKEEAEVKTKDMFLRSKNERNVAFESFDQAKNELEKKRRELEGTNELYRNTKNSAENETDPIRKEEFKKQLKSIERESFPKELKEFNSVKNKLNEKSRARASAWDKYRDSRGDTKKSQKAYNDFKEHALSKVEGKISAEMEIEGFDLSKLNLPGSREARERTTPELSTKKLQKELDELAETLKEKQKNFDTISVDNFANPEKKSKATVELEAASRIYNIKQIKLEAHKNAEEEEKQVDEIANTINQKASKGADLGSIPENTPEFRERHRKAKMNRLEIARGNTPRNLWNAKTTKGKKGRDDEKE